MNASRNEAVDVAVVMPAYNAARFVADAVRSVLAQTLGNIQLVVVDDGSTDGTPDVLRTLQDDRLLLLSGPNRGPSHARNIGIAASRPSRCVAFIDADDCWDPTKLADQVALLDARPEVVAAGCFMRYVSSSGRVLGKTGQVLRDQDRESLSKGELFPFPMSSLIARRSAIDQAGGFDELLDRRGSEDLDFLARLARVGAMACVPSIRGSYRIHAGSAMAQHRREINRAACFVRRRLAAWDAGEDLTWEQFVATHRLTPRERWQDWVERAYRAAALAYGEKRYVRAFAYGALAAFVSPAYTCRRMHRQAWGHAARRATTHAPVVRDGTTP